MQFKKCIPDRALISCGTPISCTGMSLDVLMDRMSISFNLFSSSSILFDFCLTTSSRSDIFRLYSSSWVWSILFLFGLLELCYWWAIIWKWILAIKMYTVSLNKCDFVFFVVNLISKCTYQTSTYTSTYSWYPDPYAKDLFFIVVLWYIVLYK